MMSFHAVLTDLHHLKTQNDVKKLKVIAAYDILESLDGFQVNYEGRLKSS